MSEWNPMLRKVSKETDQLVHNRRIVFTAIHRSMSAQDADKLYLYWHKNHGSKAKIEVIPLVQEFANTFGLDSSVRSQLRTTLYECLHKDDVKLEPDPGEPGGVRYEDLTPTPNPVADVQTTPTPTKALTDEDIVFLDLYQAIAVRVRRESAASWDDTAEIVVEDLETRPLADATKQEITNWQAATNQATAPMLENLEEKSTFIHMLYIAMCEVLGPSSADHVLAQAKSDASLSSASQKFSPAKFL